MMSTFTTTTGHAEWIGYQALYGLGLGLGMQQPSVAAQTVLPKKDVPIGASMMFFAQTLGGSIFVSVANNLFLNQLANGLAKADIPGVPQNLVTAVGATDLQKVVPATALSEVLSIYNSALRHAFYVGVGVSSGLILGTVGMEWKSVKQPSEPSSQSVPEKGQAGNEGNATRGGSKDGSIDIEKR